SVEITHRLLALGVSLAAGLVFLMVLHFTLEGALADFLLDRSAGYYPFTVQNAMWLVFFVGAGEIWIRHLRATRDGAQIGARYLPEDPASMLRADALAAVYSRVRPADGTAGSFLQRLIMRCILQFQSSRSIDQTNSLLNSSLELYQHEIDVDYSMLRYIVW